MSQQPQASYMGRDVFISYSRDDKEFVGKLREALIEQEQEVWIDWESIPPSQAWWSEIQKGIAKSNNFVVVLSPQSMSSPICHMEIEYARELKKRIIPVLHADYDLEACLEKMNRRLATREQETTRQIWGLRQTYNVFNSNDSELKHINYFIFKIDDDFPKRFNDLFVTIRTDYAHKDQHTTLGLRASEWERRERDKSFLLIDAELEHAQKWLADSPGKEPPPTTLHTDYIRASEGRTRELRDIRRASILGTVGAVVAIIFAVIASIVGIQASAQVAGLQPTLDGAETQIAGVQPTLDDAETQIAGVAPTLEEARAQIVIANDALTPIPLTLTPAYLTLQAADYLAATAQENVNQLGQTLTPIPLTLAYSQAQATLAQINSQLANDAAATAALQATNANNNILAARTEVGAANGTLTPIAGTLAAAEALVAGVQPTLQSAASQIAGVQPTLNGAETQIAGVAPTLEEARAQIAIANAALTPIPLTLTPAYLTLQAADYLAATAQQDVIVFGQTLTPIPLTLAYSAAQGTLAQIGIQDANYSAATAALQATTANNSMLEARNQVVAANATLTPIAGTLAAAGTRVAGVEPTLEEARAQVAVANDSMLEARNQVMVANGTLTPIAGTLAAAEALVAGVEPTLQMAASQIAGVQPTLDGAETRVAGVQPTLNRAETQVAEVNPTLTGVALEIFQQQEIADSLRLAASAEQLLDAGDPDVSLALALKAYELNDELPQVQRVLNSLRPFTPRYVTTISTANRPNVNIAPQLLSYAAFSPDGSSIAIPENEGQVIIRDLTTRRILFTLEPGGRANVIRYSGNGKYLAVGTNAGAVIFETTTGFERMRFGDRATITALAFSGDERYIIAGLNRGGAQVWDIDARTQYMTLNTVPNDGRLNTIVNVAFNENASQVYAYDGSQLNIGEMSDKRVRFSLIGNIRSVNLSMNYGVVGGDGNSPVSLWSPINYNPIREFRLGSFDTDYLETIAFSRDRRYVLVHMESRYYTDTIRNRYVVTGRWIEYWRIEDGARVTVLQTPDLSPTVWDVTAMAISDDGRYAITGGYYGAVASASVWDLQTGEELRRFEGHDSAILEAGFSPSGTSIYTISQDSVRVWDLGDPRSSAQSQFIPNASQIEQMGFSADQSELFLAYNDQALGRWRLSTQTLDTRRPIVTGDQVAVAFSLANPLALVASIESLTLWNLDTTEFLYRFPNIDPEDVRVAHFGRDGRYVYFLEGRSLWQWNIADNEGSENSVVTGAAFFAIDSLDELALTASAHSLTLTDMITHRSTVTYEGYEGDVMAVDLSGGADRVIAGIGEPENAVMIWDARTGSRLFDLRAHTQPVTAVAFSPDGKLAVSGSIDTSLILWDVATGQVLQTFRGHTAPISEIVFAPDGRTFATRSENVEDGILFWRAETGQETIDWMFNNRNITDLTCDQRVQFNVRPACLEGGVAPTSTPSMTPIPTQGPTATFTPRPTATITQTPLPRAEVITDERIRLRRGFEGELYTYIDGTAEPGDMVTILEIRQDIGWVRVETDGGERGWTRIEFLDQ